MIKVENIVGPSPEQWAAVVRGVRNPKNSWDKSDSLLVKREDLSSFYEEEIISLSGVKDTESEFMKIYDDCELFMQSDYLSNHIGSNDKGSMLYIGPKDLKLMTSLASAGPDHGKFLRQLDVWADITAPTFWWLQFDTYKIGVSSNSCSKMHRLTEKKFEVSDFYITPLKDTDIQKGYEDDPKGGWGGPPTEGLAIPDMRNGGKIDYAQYPEEVLQGLVEYLNRLREAYIQTKDKRYWNAILELLPESYMQKRTVCISFQALRNMVHQRWNHKLPIWRKILEELLNGIPYAQELIIGKVE